MYCMDSQSTVFNFRNSHRKKHITIFYSCMQMRAFRPRAVYVHIYYTLLSEQFFELVHENGK